MSKARAEEQMARFDAAMKKALNVTGPRVTVIPKGAGREEWDSADLALHIEGLFSAATDNVCTCGSAPEDHCRYCAAWAAALYKTEALLAKVLGDR